MREDDFWYVVYTRPRWEKKIIKILDERGIVNYCPLNKKLKHWSDRKKTILEPLFKGYVFIQLDDDRIWDIKKVDGIINYVYWLGKPAKVKGFEIENIRKFLQEFSDVEVVDTRVSRNVEVLIKTGVLMDYKGIVVEVVGKKARVKIMSLGIELYATFDKSNLIAI
jgi:transcription antitermination factor NusG